MKRRPIHRGGILSAGYDARARHLDVEFDTHRLVRVENIGPEAADRFLNSGSPGSYWRDVIEEGYTIRAWIPMRSRPHSPTAAMPAVFTAWSS